VASLMALLICSLPARRAAFKGAGLRPAAHPPDSVIRDEHVLHVSDGSLVFLLHLISKMRPASEGGTGAGC